MTSDKIELCIKICLLPLTEFEFYKEDYIEKLSKITDTEDFYEVYNKEVLIKVVKIMNKTQRVSNLDEVDLLLRKFYSKEYINRFQKYTNFHYMDILSRISRGLIDWRDGKIVLKHWDTKNEEYLFEALSGINKVVLWNSMNRMFTTDLLVIRYLIDNNKSDNYLNNYYNNVSIEDFQLAKILSKGVSENHLHSGASINFFISWQSDMNLTGKSKSDYSNEIFNNPLTGKDVDLGMYLPIFAVIRVLMSNFMEYYIEKDYTFKRFIDYIFKIPDDDKYNEYNYNDMEKVILNKRIKKLFELVLLGGNNEFNFEDVKSLWDYLESIGMIDLSDNSNRTHMELLEGDILYNNLSDYKHIKTTAENIFLYRAFKYIDYNKCLERGEKDKTFEKIFWQYIRLKNEVFQLKVQSNRFKGLMYFQSFYKRSTEYKAESEKYLWKVLFKNQFQNTHLRKVEFRKGFGKEKSVERIERELKLKLLDFFKAYKDVIISDFIDIYNKCHKKPVPLVGLVFHMIKLPDERYNEKCWRKSCGCDKKELYYSELQQLYFNQVSALEMIRKKFPILSKYIVGIDAASLETNTDPWVFAPVFSSIRNNEYELDYEVSEIENVRDTRFTFHVGEEFRHLLSGIRRVDEVLEHFSYSAGDRIGHGIALGVNIEKWAQRNEVLVLMRLEHLENLLWVWGLYKNGNSDITIDISYLEKMIMKFAKEVYIELDGISIFVLWKAYKKKFERFHSGKFEQKDNNEKMQNKTDKIFCNFADEVTIWNEEKLVHAHHCQRYLKKMNEPIQIEINCKEVDILKVAQRVVKNNVSRMGIIVETNPSSNIAIGEVDSIFNHYILDLNEQGLNGFSDVEKSIMVTINSDDPSVFNTNVSNEFAYIFYSLQKKGYSRENILNWIEKIRRYGMDSSFIDDRENYDTNDILKEVEYIIDLLNK